MLKAFLYFFPVCITTALCAGDPARDLHTVFAEHWEYTMERYPEYASRLGDRRFNDRWKDNSPKAFQHHHEQDKIFLRRVLAVDRSRLSAADQLNYDLFVKDMESDIEEFSYRLYLMPLSHRGGIQTSDDLANSLRFSTVKDYTDWIARLEAMPALMDQTIAIMREGMGSGMLHPKVLMRRVPRQIDKQIVAAAEESPFFKPFKSFPSSIPPEEQACLKEKAATAVADSVIPAFTKFKSFFVEEYLPASLDEVGVWQLPKGDALYKFRVRRFTTTELTPEEIHNIGLREVARIRKEMETVKGKSGFEGSLKEFFTYLRTDPRFYHETPEELLDAYRALTRRIDPLMVNLFKKLPRMPYGVMPIPENIAPDTTTAYYSRPAADGSRAGRFFINLYKPETRPKWAMMALSLHEAVPGHHLQISLAMEQGDMPNFRRYGGYTAFVEGWGLYAEFLGEEVGLYEDPYDKFGQLTYEMWRALRLVVDTGLHAFKWERRRAIDYFLENAPKSELDITNEIDRYLAWPGQALAYKIGELKFKELRRLCARTLGSDFDVRDYHDALMRSGAVPLDIAEREIKTWLKKQSAP